MDYNGKTNFYDEALNNRLSFKELFSDTFKPHPSGAIEKLLTVGVGGNISSPRRMIREWDKPWLYIRVLILGMIFVALLNFMKLEGLRAGYTLTATLPVFIAPLTLLTFFWEINIPRNISIVRVFMMFVLGGLISIAMLPFLGHYTLTKDAVQYAAFTEEPAKLLITAAIIYFMNPKYISQGIIDGYKDGTFRGNRNVTRYEAAMMLAKTLASKL